MYWPPYLWHNDIITHIIQFVRKMAYLFPENSLNDNKAQRDNHKKLSGLYSLRSISAVFYSTSISSGGDLERNDGIYY